MENIFGNIVNFIFALIGALIVIGIVIKVTINMCSKEKNINAVVIDKQSYDRKIYRKNQAPFIHKEYVVTFQCANKKRHFNVSEFSYASYRINQEGILKYKGSRLIDFK